MNKLAVLTGYSSGLGRSLADELHRRDYAIIGVARRKMPISEANDSLHKVHHISGTVSDEDTAVKTFALADRLGGASLLINCAGQGAFGAVGTYKASDIATVLEGNLAGLMLFSDRAVSHMHQTGGTIVNIISSAAKTYRANETIYGAAKWGAKAYTRALRLALKDHTPAIRVIEVYPCGMKTGFWSASIGPMTDGSLYPNPGPIAEAIISIATKPGPAYLEELTFRRTQS